MLKSEQDGNGKDEKEIRKNTIVIPNARKDRGKTLKTPRRNTSAARIDPTIPPKGTRNTYFTGMSTPSFESLKSLSRKPFLDSYMTVRVQPETIRIKDYQINGQRSEDFFTIFNYSKKVQYMTLNMSMKRKTRLFFVDKSVALKEFSIAPGLEKRIKIFFLPPSSVPENEPNSLVSSENLWKPYKDSLEIQIRNEKSITIHLEAHPPYAQLEYEKNIAIGTIQVNHPLQKEWLSLTKKSNGMKPNLAKNPISIKSGWMSTTTKLTNSGKREAKFSFEFSHYSPIRITPLSGVVDASGFKEVLIEYLPAFVGEFKEKIKVKVENQSPENPEQNATNFFLVTGNIIDRKIKLTTPLGVNILEIDSLKFGIAYFEESQYMPVIIRNQDSKRLNWALSHSHMNEANVPEYLKTTCVLPNAEDSVFFMFPKDGVLEPGESARIKIYFKPKSTSQNYHFKTKMEPPKKRNYEITMNLQTFELNQIEKIQDSIIRFKITGAAVPLLVKFSETNIAFPQNSSERIQERSVSIINQNTTLGVRFRFSKNAHFDIIPSHGELQPDESKSLNVIFRPNQYGHFQVSAKCSLFSALFEQAGTLNSEVHSDEKDCFSICLDLAASWLPGVLPKNLKQENSGINSDSLTLSENILEAESPSAIEWKKKVAHRQRYIDYIRTDTASKPSTAASTKINIQALHFVDEERLQLNNTDQRTGLTPPEPVESLLFGKRLNHFRSVIAESLKEKNQMQMQNYCQKLSEPVIFNPKPFYLSGLSPFWQEEALLPRDLKNIFASTAILDFGEVTVHSVLKLPLNFLNATISKIPIHISHSFGGDSKLLDTSCLSVIPQTLSLPHLEIGGLEVAINAHVPGDFSANLNYIVNKRYIYHVLVKAKIVALSLESSHARLDIFHELKEGYGKISKRPDNRVNNETELPESMYKTRIVNGREYKFPSSCSTFDLSNSGNCKVYFEITDSQNLVIPLPEIELLQNIFAEGVFSVSPESGWIEEYAKMTVKVTYFPGTKTFADRVYFISIYDCYNGTKALVKKIPLAIHGQSQISGCQLLLNLKQGPLDFGILPTSVKTESVELYDNNLTGLSKVQSGRFLLNGIKTIKIKNEGSNMNAFVAFVKDRACDVDIRPHSGTIASDQTIEITMSLVPSTFGVFEDELIINLIGGGKSYRIPYRYDSRKSSLEILNIGQNLPPRVIIGSTSCQMYSVANKGNVFARLIFDLQKFPDFTVRAREDRLKMASAKSYRTVEETSHNSTASMLSDKVKSEKQRGLENKGALLFAPVVDRPSSAFSTISVSGNSNRIGQLANNSLPGDKFILELVYSPKTIGVVDSLISAHLLGFKNCHSQTMNFEFPTNCQSLLSPLELSSQEIVFGDKIIHPDPKVERTANLAHLDILNISSDWWMSWNATLIFGLSEGGIFQISPKSGQMECGDKQRIEISFDPSFVGQFSCILNIAISASGIESFLSVPIKGSAINPSIMFDPPEVFLPVVPIGTPSVGVVWISNVGCDSGDIIAEIPSEIRRNDVSFDLLFPEGRFLKDEGETLPCVIKFLNKSKNPLSFTIKLLFQDPEYSKYYLPIHGTSDNSNFTLLSYNPALSVFQNSSKYYLTKRDFQTPVGLVCPNALKIAEAEAFWTSIYQSVHFWLGDLLGTNSFDPLFPANFVSSFGSNIINVIHTLAGKKVSALPAEFKNSTGDDVKQMIKFYNDLITFLSIHGAQLSSVKAEFLLCLKDFIKAQTIIEAQKSKEIAKRLEMNAQQTESFKKNFTLVSKEAWCTMLLQVVKVFLFPSSNLALLKLMPESDQVGIQSFLPPGDLSTESILLAWVSAVFKQNTGESVIFNNFKTDFNDCKAYAMLLKSYIPSTGRFFLGIFSKPLTEEQYNYNASTINDALVNTFGLLSWQNFEYTRIYKGTELDHQLMLLFLYQVLQGFTAKTDVEFAGPLYVLQCRVIELSNTSSKPISYMARLEGPNVFSIEETSFVIQPKSVYNFKVNLKSRFSRSSKGQLTIQTKKSGIYTSNVICFNLIGVSSPLKPMMTTKVQAQIYCNPPSLVTFKVHNPFRENATFKIQLEQAHVEKARAPSSGGKARSSSFSMSKASTTVLDDSRLSTTMSGSSIPSPFVNIVETIYIPGGESQELQIYFIPFEIGVHICTILFSDPEIGEFVHEVEGVAHGPISADQTNITGTAGIPVNKIIRVSPTNSLRDKAVHAYTNLISSTRSNSAGRPRSGRERQRDTGMERDLYQLPKRALRYTVEYSSPYFTGPSEITVRPPSEPRTKSNLIDPYYTELPVTFSPITAGKYSCQIFLTCLDSIDYRIFTYTGLARSEGSTAYLEFQVQAKHALLQDIPIINQSQEDWSIRAVLKGDYFTCPFLITAKAGVTTNVPVQFRPRKKCEITGFLQLHNSNTNQKYAYNLKGIGTDPEAEDVLDVTCTARESLKLQFLVPNDCPVEMQYFVVTDMPISKGEKSFIAKSEETFVYSVEILPLHAGRFTKFIKFLNEQDDSFVWFSIQLLVAPAKPDYEIDLNAIIRSSARAEIELKNPLENEAIDYKVFITGKDVAGKNSISIQKGEKSVYEVTYSPVFPGTFIGNILFSNEIYGEFSYELNLQAIQEPATDLGFLECPLGKSKSVIVYVTNPFNHEIQVTGTVSNSKNFQLFFPPLPEYQEPSRGHIVSKEFDLEPLQSTPVQLVFWPSVEREEAENEVEFSHPLMGPIIFTSRGIGLIPSEMKTYVITAEIGDSKGGVVEFYNPFYEAVSVDVSLEDNTEFRFNLTNARSRQVNALESTSIHLSYRAAAMNQSKAMLVIDVAGSKKYQWKCPLRGIPEHLCQTINLHSKVREKTEVVMDVQLPNMPEMKPRKKNAIYWGSMLDMEILGEGQLPLDRILSVQVLENSAPDSTTLALKIMFSLTPSTLTDTKASLSFVHKLTGSMWKFPLVLTANITHFDDTIIIEGVPKKTSTVFFNLENPLDRPVKFKAFFHEQKGLGKKEQDLSIRPEEGILAPQSSSKEKENQFFLSYTPKTSGKSNTAILVVETTEFSLYYDVRGITPHVKKFSR